MATAEATTEIVREPWMAFDPIQVSIQICDNGAVRVGGTRVSLSSVIYCYREGDTPETIVNEAFPVLKLADVYSVIAFYLRNRDAIDDWIRREEGEYEAWLRDHEKDWDREGFNKKVSERWAAYQAARIRESKADLDASAQ